MQEVHQAGIAFPKKKKIVILKNTKKLPEIVTQFNHRFENDFI
jgi:hypothetical protein